MRSRALRPGAWVELHSCPHSESTQRSPSVTGKDKAPGSPLSARLYHSLPCALNHAPRELSPSTGWPNKGPHPAAEWMRKEQEDLSTGDPRSPCACDRLQRPPCSPRGTWQLTLCSRAVTSRRKFAARGPVFQGSILPASRQAGPPPISVFQLESM